MIRILQISNPKEIRHIMQAIRVDDYGIKIMLPKSITHLVRINSLSSITANILKQEMLSLGADAAVTRGALTGKVKKTDCLLMANLSQFNRLTEKLKKQPFGLDRLACDLSNCLVNYQKDEFKLDFGSYKLALGPKRTYLMGIVNITPDSFSGDGLYKSSVSGDRSPIGKIVGIVEKMVDDGADIIDIGGESSRPGAKQITVEEELKRTIPIIKKIAKTIKAPISIDTYKPEVAREALDNGAVMVNDITGLKNTMMARIVSKYKAALIIMHMKGSPGTMQANPAYESLIDEIITYLNKRIAQAASFGIDRNKIIIDPGIGFGKAFEHNLELLKGIKEFKILGRPLLVGVSRKSFIGKILNVAPQERIFGTISSCVLAVKNGVNILRVHDVKEVRQAIKVIDAIENI